MTYVAHRPALCAAYVAAALLPMSGRAAEADTSPTLAEVVVTATRSPSLIRDEPLRVEAVPAEEIEENLTSQPGNVSTLLRELPGVHVQSSAAALGGAAMQLCGMPGRYTQVLNDGLPVLGSEADAFGLLQLPPLDLERVEVIKGVASALYGGGALGGILNLVSRTPDSEPGFIADVTSRGGWDLLGFLTARGESSWSGTLTAGAYGQSRQDIDRDGWADLAAFRRYTLRPRAWWQGEGGRSLLLTAGVMDESRHGGTMPGQVLPDGSAFGEALHTRRLDLGAVNHWPLDDSSTLDGRFFMTSVSQDRSFGSWRSDSQQVTAYAEEAWRGNLEGHRWVLGAAFEHDELSAPDAAGVGHGYDIPSLFLQDTFAPADWVTLAGSARVDSNNDYGTFLSARASALLREADGPWNLRLSAGNGYAVPTPFVEEVEATWLGALLPLQGLQAERAANVSLDVGWTQGDWEVNVGSFASTVRHAVQVRSRPGDRLELVNASGPRRVLGAEVLVGYVHGPLHAIASWSDIHATEVDASGVRHDATRVPRQAATLDAILESERRGRIGVELEYTGRQVLDENPYRNSSPGFWQVNLLAEVRLGDVGLFVNAVNLTDVRQSDHDPLIRPFPGPGGDPITEAWAPLAGRVLNAGVRGEF